MHFSLVVSGRAPRARARRADLSQHFLREARAARLVQATSIEQSDFVIEIGAGRGALTKPLLKRTKQLVAVEIDRFLAERLSKRFSDKVEVVVRDFLELDLPDYPYKAIGNVPYALTTQIVRKLVESPTPPDDAWLVVQREAAWRLCGRPYLPESLWSLRLKPKWHVEITDRLKRNDFDPPPKVDSVFLWLCRRNKDLLTPEECEIYRELVSTAYGSPDKRLHVSLRRWVTKPQLGRLARDLRFEPDAAPSGLMFEQWLGIVRFLSQNGRHPRRV